MPNNISRAWKWIGNHYFVPATIGPALLILLAFVYLPSLYSFFLSFYKTKLFVPVDFVGLKNYISVLKDPIFIKALKNTVLYSIGAITGTIVCGLGLALILDSKVRGKDLFRTAFFIPYILPYAAFTLLWYWMFDPRYGLVNYVLNILSIQAVPWLQSSSWVIPAFILMDIWKRAGFAMVLFLAGLQTIPPELYDSATVDGAGEVAKFRHITFPLLAPVTLFVVIMSFLHTFQLFTEPFVMTKGGPNNASISLVYLMYQVGFTALNVGRSSAIAVILFILIFILTIIIVRRFDIEEIYS
jgi:multiple sugar transport system permease protein